MSTISSSITLTQTLINGYSWPVTISGGTSSTPTIVTLGENITLNNVNNYFIFGSQYITFDGAGFTVTIDGVTFWNGLIQNGLTNTSGYAYCNIKNLGVLSTGSTINSSGGWICQKFYGRNVPNNIIENCYSNGNITGSSSGGICGGDSCKGPGAGLEIMNCYFTGEISGNNAGGICGSRPGHTYSSCIITKCFSTGIISGPGSGGICGIGAGYYQNGYCEINECYSLGEISGMAAGGIVGNDAGIRDGQCKIQNCYSIGKISGSLSGGICGNFAANFNGSPSGICSVTNTYSYGVITGSSAGGIYGPSNSVNATSTNTYIANGYWNNDTANSTLIGKPVSTPIGTVWTKISLNYPWVLSTFNSTLYSPNSATTTNTIYTSSAGLLTGVSYNSFNSSTSATVSATSDTRVLNFTNLVSGANIASVIAYKGSISPNIYYGYNINTFTVNATITTPNVNTQPVSQTVNSGSSGSSGSSVTFTVGATGSSPITYQWLKNGTNISGATSSTYTINSVLSSDSGTYTVTVSNSAGSELSSSAILTVIVPPTITTQPSSQTVNLDSSVIFSLVATNGGGTLSYQWAKDDSNISGAILSTYTISSASLTDSGTYTVTVSNSAGSILSSGAVLTINRPNPGVPLNSSPLIYSQPQTQMAKIGGRVVFQTYAYSLTPITYQWFFNDQPIQGATNLYLIIDPVTQQNPGKYYVVFTNTAGSTKSSDAYLTISKI